MDAPTESGKSIMSLAERAKNIESRSKICLYLLICFFMILACNVENKIYRIEKHSDSVTSLIEHLYIFEEEDFEISAFFVRKDLNRNEYVLNLYLKGNVSSFSKDHRAFFHGFKNISDSDKSINIVLNDSRTKGDSLVFSKTLILKKDSLFEKVNFGLENTISKQRKFVLTLKNVDLHEFPR